jgi:hypothetical protein
VSIDHAQVHETKRSRLLQLMSDLDWHVHWQLQRVAGVRYSARLLELKRLGYEIEDQDLEHDNGKRYRLKSLEPGAPKSKQVKIFMDEQDADMAAHGVLTHPAMRAIADALGSFRANKGKL